METILHIYHPTRDLLLLEYANKTGTVSNVIRMGSHSGPSNVLLFVGGLYDNFRSPAYIEDIAALFPRDVPGQKWRVMHVQMSSSGKTFGLYDLDRDVGCLYSSTHCILVFDLGGLPFQHSCTGPNLTSSFLMTQPLHSIS